MDSQVENLWMIANILGAVVIVVVVALLTLLVIFVARIRKRVDAIKATNSVPARCRSTCLTQTDCLIRLTLCHRITTLQQRNLV